MATPQFDREGAKKAGWSDSEIDAFLAGKPEASASSNDLITVPGHNLPVSRSNPPAGEHFEQDKQGNDYLAKDDQSQFNPKWEAMKALFASNGIPTERGQVAALAGTAVGLSPLALGPDGAALMPVTLPAGESVRQLIAGEKQQLGKQLGMAPAGLLGPTGKPALTALDLALKTALGKNIETTVDEGRPATMRETLTTALPASALGGTLSRLAQTRTTGNPVLDELTTSNASAEPAVKLGARVLPSKQNPTLLNKVLDRAAGYGEIATKAQEANNKLNVALANETMGYGNAKAAPDLVLSQAKIDFAKQAIGDQYYKPVAAVSPASAKALQTYQEAKVAADDAASAYASQRTKASRVESEQAATDLAAAETNLKNLAGNSLFNAMKEGEKKYAQVVAVENAANVKGGSIDPAKLRSLDDKTGVLTDGIKTIADLQGAIGPSLDKEITKMSTPTARFMRFSPVITGGIVGGTLGGTPGAVGGAGLVEAMKLAALKRQLSNSVQEAAVAPKFTKGAIVDSDLAKLMRYAAVQQALQAGQNQQ